MSEAVKQLRDMIALYQEQNLVAPWVWKDVCDEHDAMRDALWRIENDSISWEDATLIARAALGEGKE